MENLQILLIDDDEHHLNNLSQRLYNLSYKNIVEAIGFKQGSVFLKSMQPDLIIIDYYLDNGKTCIDFIKENLINNLTPVIVISAFFDEKTFKEIKRIKPIDFLSKNCSDFELKKSLDLSLIKNISRNDKIANPKIYFVKVGNNIKKIKVKDIEMIRVDGKYIILHIENREYPIRSSLNNFLKKLPETFIKVHQSYIVNLDFLESINPEKNKIKLKNCEAYYSRNYKKTLFNYYLLS
ncbi:LytR/AlgR family response regulator transcription factor [Aestuariivivens insulae]|uniref:LytR/AlgR family response regulator transcription factor n=1 Tax=Aestuariivivens insulae TaxID=1621988 RepID=UPI001F5AB786|nr:response regulator transcription factor [Aestuariivivens insulae]